jgi:hypothetical protein
MTHRDRERDRGNRRQDSHDPATSRPVQRVPAGKRTLTMGSSAPSPRGPAARQRKPAAGLAPASTRRAVGVEDWMGVALRPDLQQAPVMRASASDAGYAGDMPAAASGGGAPMPAAVQARMEHALGADFSRVRIHEDPGAQAIGALAYTQGTDIHFAPGQYDPGSRRGQELLGHELTHVVQQAQGRVQATAQASGAAVNEDPALEREADETGARAARGEPARVPGAAAASVGASASPGAMQLKSGTVVRNGPLVFIEEADEDRERHLVTDPSGEQLQLLDGDMVDFDLEGSDVVINRIVQRVSAVPEQSTSGSTWSGDSRLEPDQEDELVALLENTHLRQQFWSRGAPPARARRKPTKDPILDALRRQLPNIRSAALIEQLLDLLPRDDRRYERVRRKLLAKLRARGEEPLTRERVQSLWAEVFPVLPKGISGADGCNVRLQDVGVLLAQRDHRVGRALYGLWVILTDATKKGLAPMGWLNHVAPAIDCEGETLILDSFLFADQGGIGTLDEWLAAMGVDRHMVKLRRAPWESSDMPTKSPSLSQVVDGLVLDPEHLFNHGWTKK